MIKLEDSEIWALNLIQGNIQEQQAELNRMLAARASVMQLLELKYNAIFDSATGKFQEKQPKPEKKPKSKG